MIAVSPYPPSSQESDYIIYSLFSTSHGKKQKRACWFSKAELEGFLDCVYKRRDVFYGSFNGNTKGI